MDGLIIDFSRPPSQGAAFLYCLGVNGSRRSASPSPLFQMSRLSEQFRRQLEEATASLERAQALLASAPSADQQTEEWLTEWSRWTD